MIASRDREIWNLSEGSWYRSEDMDKLTKMYENETEMLNADTERRKNHISQMLKELKYS